MAVSCCVPLVKIEGAAGVTTTLVNTDGGGRTVSDAGPLLMPEADAVMWTVPGATPVATLPLRVATEPLPSEAQVNVIPLIKLLNWSYPVAVYAWVWPAEIEAVDGDTLIWVNIGWGAGGSATVMITDVLLTPALTSIVPVPAERPLTRPVGLTLAALLELENVNVIPGMTMPF